jgi:hypothetical protein
MMMIMSLKKEINEKGYLICKKVFFPDEIQSFREAAIRGGKFPGDLLSDDFFKDVLLHDRLLEKFREIIETEKLFYFGDSSITIDRKGNGFHKDSRDRKKDESIDWNDDYSLIRCGIYLQDHTKHSGGLCLREGSHKFSSTNKGRILNIKSEVGDVVFWKLTTTHSANARTLKHFPNVYLHPRIERRLPGALMQPFPRPRIAVFITFGKDDNHLSRYIEMLKTRKYMFRKWKATHHTDEQLAAARSKGVHVLDIPGILNDIREEELFEEFVQI